jgi:predicted cupin superfamily sugar epimerase
MTAVRITARSLIALFAAMALMLVVVLATFSAASSDRAASTWHKVSAASTWHSVTGSPDASTWHNVSAASTWHSVTAAQDASTWH